MVVHVVDLVNPMADHFVNYLNQRIAVCGQE